MNFNSVRRWLFPAGYKHDLVELIKRAVPITLGNISQSFLPMVSLIMCGHLGEKELGAIALANTLFSLIVMTNILGFSTAVDTLFPQLFGGQDKKKMGVLLQKALFIGMISMFISCSILMNAKYIMSIFVDSEEVARIADEFLLISVPSVLFYTVSILLGKYLQSQNCTLPVMIINFGAIIFEAILQAILIYGLNMGTKGAAIGLDCATLLAASSVFAYIYFKKIYVKTWSGWSYDCLNDWSMYLKLAIPGLLTLLIEWSNFQIGILTSASVSNEELALVSICQQVISVTYQIPFGLAISTNIYLGQLLGSGQPDRAKNSYRVAFTIAWFMGALTFCAVFFGSSYIPLIYSNNKNVIERANGLVKFTAFIHLLDVTQGISLGVLRSVGAQLYSSVFLFIAFYCVSTPVGVSLLLLTPLRATGFYVGVFSGLVVLVILQFVYIFRIDWKEKSDQAVKLAAPVNKNPLDENEFELEETKQLLNPSANRAQSNRIRKQIIKRFSVLFLVAVVFVCSIYTHGLISFDEIYKNRVNSTLNETTSIVYSSTSLPV